MSGTSTVTAVIYAGTAQSLNSLSRKLVSRELLVRGTLYQSCHSRSCGGFFLSRSCRLAAITFLSSK